MDREARKAFFLFLATATREEIERKAEKVKQYEYYSSDHEDLRSCKFMINEIEAELKARDEVEAVVAKQS